jgi:hypothetical protein
VESDETPRCSGLEELCFFYGVAMSPLPQHPKGAIVFLEEILKDVGLPPSGNRRDIFFFAASELGLTEEDQPNRR